MVRVFLETPFEAMSGQLSSDSRFYFKVVNGKTYMGLLPRYDISRNNKRVINKGGR